MSRVFLSYAAQDEDFAAKLRRALAEQGADVFDPSKDLAPSDDIWDSLLTRLKKSDLMVFVVPRYQGQGKHALSELGAAKALEKRIVSVLRDRTRLANNDVASALGNTYLLDETGKNLKTLAGQLLSDLAAA